MSLMVDDDLDFLEGDSDDGSGFDASALLAEPILDDDSGEFGLSNAAGSSGGIMPTNPTMPNNSNASSFNSNMVLLLKMQQNAMQQQLNQFQEQVHQPQQNSFNGFNQHSNMNNSMDTSMNSMNNGMSNTNSNTNNMNSSMSNLNSNLNSSMNSNMRMPQNQLMHNRSNGDVDSYISLNDTNGMHGQESQHIVSMNMQKLQQQMQQVQSQIQLVQFQSTQLEMHSSHGDGQNSIPQNGMAIMNLPQNILNNMGNMNTMNTLNNMGNMNNMNTINDVNNMNSVNQAGNQQSSFGLQGMLNSSNGMSRRTPDRSFSAPVVPRSARFSSSFIDQPQERRPQKQAQGGTSLAAMAASLQGGGQGLAGQGSSGGGPPGNVNEAMEKLCESMRRSAMSRSMVRQLSGRSAPTSRGMPRSKSGGLPRGTLSRNPSGRSIQRANSGTESLRGTPIRRPTQDTKHRIQRDALSNSGGPPGRGVFRHKSSQGALGGTTRLQIDDSTVGMF